VNVAPASAAITVTDHGLAHMLRRVKAAVKPDLPVLRTLPILLAVPDAILWDRDKKNLVYVVALAGERGTRLVIELDRSVKIRNEAGKRPRVPTNAIINGQIIGVDALRDRRTYELISGKL
jgi:hypothetical protein